MIVFHGTVEENLKSMKKQGILDATQDQWLMEVTQKKVCCVGSQPTAGEGGNPSYFAYGNPKTKNQDGYLVVIDLPLEFLQQKVIVIFDNKVLDDYVRFHFFPRQEFREIGFDLWEAIHQYKMEKDRYLSKIEDLFSTRDATPEDTIIQAPDDQRAYYKKIFDRDARKMHSLLGVNFSDEFYAMVKQIGTWEPFYEFLRHHFEKIDSDKYYEFYDANSSLPLVEYWQKFYQYFPISPAEKKYEYWQNWFSHQWLAIRTMNDVSKNCQILCHSIPPEYIKGFIQITTPSGFAGRFRSCRSGSRFLSEVWKEALKIAKG